MNHFYDTIEGWSDGILPIYADAVQRFPSGATFVEVGSWAGRSAAIMAVEIINSGKQIAFDVVDHWRGGHHDEGMKQEAGKRDVQAEFNANLTRGEVRHVIRQQHKMASGWAARQYADASLDFVFIDASHDTDSVAHDLLAWWPKLKPTGVLAGHDYEGFGRTWVAEAVHKLFPRAAVQDRGKCFWIEKQGTPDPEQSKARPRVIVALPNRPGDSVSGKTVASLNSTGTDHKLLWVHGRSMSLLNYNFNIAWTDALNRRGEFDYFVMLHADVAPEPGWIDKLIAEYERVGADVLSCVIAIKDEDGLSSTGIMNWNDRVMRKISIAQALQLPKTFDAQTVGADVLLLNTGCWICRMDQPWVEKACFRSFDWTYQDGNGEWKAGCIGEDYLWSVDLARLGVKTFATTAVKILHAGTFDYPNHVAWGDPDAREVKFDWEEEPSRGDRHEREPRFSVAVGGNGEQVHVGRAECAERTECAT